MKISRLIYNSAIYGMWVGISIASVFSVKIKKLRAGASTSLSQLIKWRAKEKDNPVLWLHCASLGEFEQAKPVLEWIRAEWKPIKIVLTFFSPSGYEIKKHEPLVNLVLYLPPDFPTLSYQWIGELQPSYVIFVKYEFWYNLLFAAHQSKAQMICISTAFRAEQAFFKWYGGLYREMLSFFDQLFLQNNVSLHLLKSIGIQTAIVSGDTRYDRVSGIASKNESIGLIEEWTKGKKVLVAGSVWPEDMKAIEKSLALFDQVILAPHDVSPQGIAAIAKYIIMDYCLYSDFDATKRCLIIDSIGLLSRLYKYASIAYVGGAFKQGLHNILEPAAWSVPVVFGPQLYKYPEAKLMIEAGGGFSIRDATSCYDTFSVLLKNHEIPGRKASEFIQMQKGAVQKITEYISSEWKG